MEFKKKGLYGNKISIYLILKAKISITQYPRGFIGDPSHFEVMMIIESTTSRTFKNQFLFLFKKTFFVFNKLWRYLWETSFS